MILSLLLFSACFGTKSADSASPTASNDSCSEARDTFYEYVQSLTENLDYQSCTTSDQCDGGYCNDICGISCFSFIANTANYDLISDQLREFSDANCQACIGYEYEIYPEPVTEPAWCEEGECQ